MARSMAARLARLEQHGAGSVLAIAESGEGVRIERPWRAEPISEATFWRHFAGRSVVLRRYERESETP